MNKKSKLIIGGIALLGLLIAGYFYLDSLLFDGVRPQSLHENGFQANYFAKDELQAQPAVVVIGGGEWGDYWAQEFAKANYAGLSLPYSGLEGLPKLLEEIPLEYFKAALDWLKERPEVDPDKIVVMGASRNAELALVLGSYFPKAIHGVIAFCPSSVAWPNAVHAFNSDVLKPTWTFENEAVPYIPMEKLKGSTSDTLETLSYWQKGLSDSAAVAAASIPVEKINGPILLLSGLDDKVWPATQMADMMASRIENRSFKFEFENIQYKNAGHLISGNPNFPASSRYGQMKIEGKTYAYGFGGTTDGDVAAQKDASKRIFHFLSQLNEK